MTKSSDMEATRSIGNEARSTRPLRVHNEGSFWLWFVLSGFLGLLGGIIATQGKGSGATIGLLVCVTLAIIVLAYGVFGAKRWTDFDDEIVVQYLLKQRRICWEDVSFVSFEEHSGKVRTGIPFVHVPVTTHTMTIRLRGGGKYMSYISPEFKPKVQSIAAEKANLDHQTEADRLGRAVHSETLQGLCLFGLMGLCAAIGGAVFASTTWEEEVADGINSTKWPTAKATITTAYVGSEMSKTGRRGRFTSRYFPVVNYDYIVGEKVHHGARFRFSPMKSTDAGQIGDLIREFQPGTETRVSHKPDDPAHSVLVPGLPASRYFMFAVFVGTGILGLVVVGVCVGIGRLVIIRRSA